LDLAVEYYTKVTDAIDWLVVNSKGFEGTSKTVAGISHYQVADRSEQPNITAYSLYLDELDNLQSDTKYYLDIAIRLYRDGLVEGSSDHSEASTYYKKYQKGLGLIVDNCIFRGKAFSYYKGNDYVDIFDY